MGLDWIILVLVGLSLLVGLALLFRGRGKEASGEARLEALSRDLDRVEKALREEMARGREEARSSERAAREEMGKSLSGLAQTNERKLEGVQETLERRLGSLQEDNGKRLEQMRQVVDEKLQTTLEKRLGESFRSVSERLEQVHRGLGEMQTLASEVGSLQRVLTNVKTRGTWGEVQLEALLQQVLAPEQYARNVVTKAGGNERVEFALKLPGREGVNGSQVWLPIDAKFPQEDYQRLNEALEKGDGAAAEEAAKGLTQRIKLEAKAIRDKYLDPPHTTDFGILFLPTEGLYAEVLRQPGLLDVLQREHRIVVTGPTTLAAILNSLQVGFRTLAIEKRSGEVWNLLGVVKKEFGNFAVILEKTQKKLQEASNTIEDAAQKTRTIEKKLRNVEGLPSAEVPSLPQEQVPPES